MGVSGLAGGRRMWAGIAGRAVGVMTAMALGGAAATAAPVGLRVEGRVDPLGIDALRPVLSWRSDATARDWKQAAYRVEVARTAAGLASGKADVWDTGRVASGESVGIAYAGPQLESGRRYFWRVRTWDAAGKEEVAGREERATGPAWWEMGLLTPEAWSAKWIGHEGAAERAVLARVKWLTPAGVDARAVPAKAMAEFRYRLHLDAVPEAAVLHVLSGGRFTTMVNGVVTGGKEDWGAFDWEDVRGQMKAGDNEIVIRTTARGGREATKTYVQATAAALVLEEQGKRRAIASDASWSARAGEGATWAAAAEVGGLKELRVSVGSDREVMMPAPERLASGVSLLRSGFEVKGPVRSARLYVTAMGGYRAFLNGRRVGETELTPGFTDFRKRVLYQTYDVTAMVHSGKNVLGAMLAAGWHSSPLLWAGVREYPGPDLLRAELVLRMADGTTKVVGTDGTWKGAEDATETAEIYGGEAYDARRAQAGWSTAKFAPGSGWTAATEGEAPAGMQVTAEPDRAVHMAQQVQPVTMQAIPASAGEPAATVFDMGQNMVGVVRLRVRGERGQMVRLRFAERLKPDGSIYTENLRNADATDEYTLRGGGAVEEWTPAFTFHGFRYVQVTGLPLGAGKEALEGEVWNSLPERPALRFSSSSALLNSMYALGLWGQRGNFVSVPTDCPQRDERMGWMGDAGVFWRTGAYNFDIDAFTHKFMNDVVDGQTERGEFPNIAPNLLLVGPEGQGAPGWGDAGVLVPYATWIQYGDRSVLDRNWEAMERWMGFIEQTNPNGLRQKELGPNYADWLAPDPNTPKDLVATAYWALIAQQMQAMAQATGRTAEAKRYAALHERIRTAYQAAYVKSDGTVAGGTQTAYVLSLYAGLAKDGQKKRMTEQLVVNIEAHGNHLTTGFLGTPFLLFVLDEQGRSDVAYRLLLSDTYPSWGYMVSKGATTWWERWNGDTGDPSMNSYNHYAFGSVMAWVYRRVSGIDTDAAGVGFHHVVIRPRTDATLTHARTEYDSAYGTIVTDWTREASGALAMAVTLPANTTATVELPKGTQGEATQDSKRMQASGEVVRAEVGSGTYRFVVR